MSAARSLGNLGNQNALTVDIANLKVGIVSTSPVGDLQVGAAITMGAASGIITATSYYGDGSTLTGIGQTVNVGTSNLFVVGVSTLSGFTTTGTDVYVAGVVTATSFYDSSGVAIAGTANVSTTGLFVVGVSTLSGTVAIPDSTSLTMGDDDDLELFHTAGGNTYIKNNTGELEIRSDTTKIFNKSTSQTIAGFTQGASVGITTVGILTAYDSITVKVGSGSTELTTALNTKASTGKAIAMAMVFGF